MGSCTSGINEPLALDPLLPQNDGDRDHGQVHGGDEGEPVKQGCQPHPPRYAASEGSAFVEVLYIGEFPEGDDPVGDVRQQQFAPVVFGRGVVDDAGDVGEQEGGESPFGNGGGDDPHDIDEGQLGPAQHPGAAQQAEEGVEEQDQEEEEDDGGGSVEVGGDAGAVQHHVAIRHSAADGGSPQSADEERANGRSEGGGGRVQDGPPGGKDDRGRALRVPGFFEPVNEPSPGPAGGTEPGGEINLTCCRTAC